MSVGVKYQITSSLKIAKFLKQHPAVASVNYPGLKDHPQYRRACKLFDGFSGMLSFELKGDIKAAKNFFNKVKIPTIAPSLGGVETLITRPAKTSHSGMTPEDREKIGITDSLIRLSVGIEAAEEIIEDFDQALKN